MILDRDIAKYYIFHNITCIKSNKLMASRQKWITQFGHNFSKIFYGPVDLGITKSTNKYIYIYVYWCFQLFSDQLQIITNEIYIVENNRKVVLNVFLRLLVYQWWYAHNWNGSHFEISQYGWHTGAPKAGSGSKYYR